MEKSTDWKKVWKSKSSRMSKEEQDKIFNDLDKLIYSSNIPIDAIKKELNAWEKTDFHKYRGFWQQVVLTLLPVCSEQPVHLQDVKFLGEWNSFRPAW